MRLDKAVNARRNIIYGLIWRIYITAMPFVIRTIFIYKLGVEYLGLDSLFISILNVLSLAELGIGSALVYHMYKAIALDDKDQIQTSASSPWCHIVVAKLEPTLLQAFNGKSMLMLQ